MAFAWILLDTKWDTYWFIRINVKSKGNWREDPEYCLCTRDIDDLNSMTLEWILPCSISIDFQAYVCRVKFIVGNNSKGTGVQDGLIF